MPVLAAGFQLHDLGGGGFRHGIAARVVGDDGAFAVYVLCVLDGVAGTVENDLGDGDGGHFVVVAVYHYLLTGAIDRDILPIGVDDYAIELRAVEFLPRFGFVDVDVRPWNGDIDRHDVGGIDGRLGSARRGGRRRLFMLLNAVPRDAALHIARRGGQHYGDRRKNDGKFDHDPVQPSAISVSTLNCTALARNSRSFITNSR